MSSPPLSFTLLSQSLIKVCLFLLLDNERERERRRRKKSTIHYNKDETKNEIITKITSLTNFQSKLAKLYSKECPFRLCRKIPNLQIRMLD